MKIYLDNLIVEVTRRCNMHCAHCLRGDAENIDQSKKNVDVILSQVKEINMLTFTGGEPSLNIPIMRYFLEQCKKKRIPVGNFYIVTNGKEVSDEFLNLLIEWNCYTGCGNEADFNGVALSKDSFHEKIPKANELKLRSLAFFREDKFTDFGTVGLLDSGRAASLTGYDKRAVRHYGIEIEEYDGSDDSGKEYQVNGEVVLSCNGNLLDACDYSFACENDYRICHVSEFPRYVKNLVLAE